MRLWPGSGARVRWGGGVVEALNPTNERRCVLRPRGIALQYALDFTGGDREGRLGGGRQEGMFDTAPKQLGAALGLLDRLFHHRRPIGDRGVRFSGRGTGVIYDPVASSIRCASD